MKIICNLKSALDKKLPGINERLSTGNAKATSSVSIEDKVLRIWIIWKIDKFRTGLYVNCDNKDFINNDVEETVEHIVNACCVSAGRFIREVLLDLPEEVKEKYIACEV